MKKHLLDSPLVTIPSIDLGITDPAALRALVMERHATCIAQSNEIVSLTSQACTDPLTGLLNRRGLERCLSKMIANSTRAGTSLYVLHIDLDDFKQINDTLGHAAGDLTLVTVAHRLEGMVRAGDVVARLGGDEFLVALDLPKVQSVTECAQGIAQRVIQTITEPFQLGRDTVSVRASVGGVEHSQASHPTAAALISMADDAMYQAKRAGKAGFVMNRAGVLISG